jgi:hypothetical protein
LLLSNIPQFGSIVLSNVRLGESITVMPPPFELEDEIEAFEVEVEVEFIEPDPALFPKPEFVDVVVFVVVVTVVKVDGNVIVVFLIMIV